MRADTVGGRRAALSGRGGMLAGLRRLLRSVLVQFGLRLLPAGVGL